MDLSKKLLTLLAIFCVIASAGAVCATDNGDYLDSSYADDSYGYDESQYQDDYGIDDTQSQDAYGYAGSQYEDGGYAGSQYQDDGGWAGSQYNETLENANATNSNPLAAGEPANTTDHNVTNSTPMAAGEPTNTTANITANAASHKMLSTGNPIILLLGVSAVLGGYAVLRRK